MRRRRLINVDVASSILLLSIISPEILWDYAMRIRPCCPLLCYSVNSYISFDLNSIGSNDLWLIKESWFFLPEKGHKSLNWTSLSIILSHISPRFVLVLRKHRFILQNTALLFILFLNSIFTQSFTGLLIWHLLDAERVIKRHEYDCLIHLYIFIYYKVL